MTAENGSPDRRRPSTRPPRRGGPVFLWAVLLLLAAAGAGWWILDRSARVGPAVPEGPQEGPVVEAPVVGDRAVQIVFPEWDAAGYVTEERQIPSRDRAGEELLGIMRTLCEGPKVSGAISAMPRGTRALAAFVDPQDLSVVLDFSAELVTRHPGGSLAETATLTSILRTVALNYPRTRSCVILIEGAQVETLAGHLEMSRPFDPREWL